ncbi:MAG: FHA domain-containing protein, partial [Deltaproteobacteria bacterium]|nr:FHA domain-containing protein [Deltaproteobacteria bacterium]
MVLTVISGRETGKTREITRGGAVTIGRSEGNMFQVAEKGVSRRHCAVENKGNRVILRDLGSSNGTFVNDEKVNACLLESGDRIGIGLAVLKVTMRGQGSGAVRRQSSLDLVQEGPTGEFRQRVVNVDKTQLMTALPDIPTGKAEEVVRAHAGLQALFKVGGAINAAEDMSALYETIIDSVLEVSGAERAALLIRDPDSGSIEPAAVQRSGNVPDSNIQVSKTVVEEVMAKGVSALSNNALDDPRFTKGDSITDQNIKAVMCVPVTGK